MRFSSVFQLPLTPRLDAAREGSARRREDTADAKTPVALPQDLPEELDARVRLVGEWQLGEG